MSSNFHCIPDAVTDYQADVTYRLVDTRWREVKPTFCTINLPVGEADAVLGAAVADRLRHNALILPCRWPSWRSRETNGDIGRERGHA